MRVVDIHNRTVRRKLNRKLRYTLFRNINEIAGMWCREEIGREFYVKGNFLHCNVEISEYRTDWEYSNIPLERLDWIMIIQVHPDDVNGELYEDEEMELATLMLYIAYFNLGDYKFGEVSLDELEEIQPY